MSPSLTSIHRPGSSLYALSMPLLHLNPDTAHFRVVSTDNVNVHVYRIVKLISTVSGHITSLSVHNTFPGSPSPPRPGPPDDRRDERAERPVPVAFGSQRCLEPRTSWSGLRHPKGAGSAQQMLSAAPPSPSAMGTGRNAGLPNPSSLPAIIS